MSKNKLEEEFYSELDKDKKYNRWRILLIAFWALLLCFIFGCYYLYSLTKIETPKSAIKISDTDAQKVVESIEFVNQNPSTQNISISEAELSSYLFLQTEEGSHKIKNLTAKIDPDKIILSGRLLSPIESSVEAEVIPEVSAGRLNLNIDQISIGQLKIKKLFINLFGKKYLSRITEILNQPQNMTIDNIKLEKGQLDISGRVF